MRLLCGGDAFLCLVLGSGSSSEVIIHILVFFIVISIVIVRITCVSRLFPSRLDLRVDVGVDVIYTELLLCLRKNSKKGILKGKLFICNDNRWCRDVERVPEVVKLCAKLLKTLFLFCVDEAKAEVDNRLLVCDAGDLE